MSEHLNSSSIHGHVAESGYVFHDYVRASFGDVQLLVSTEFAEQIRRAHADVNEAR